MGDEMKIDIHDRFIKILNTLAEILVVWALLMLVILICHKSMELITK